MTRHDVMFLWMVAANLLQGVIIIILGERTRKLREIKK